MIFLKKFILIFLNHDYKPVLRDVLLDCPKSDGTLYSEYKTKIFEQVPPGGYWRDIDPEIAKEYM